MEDSTLYVVLQSSNDYKFSIPTIRLLARRPSVAIIIFILCGIIIMPAIIFTILTITALFLTKIGLFEIYGENGALMLCKVMFSGFLTSVAIVLFVTSGTIFAWYYGLIRMYGHYFQTKTRQTPKQK